ncbi:MAG TPA: DPP IV N-terminal domain-containing protein [Herpetosiphonaceae bacterium]|nr:DPP IV N-terminal domain-containing protein [Herpetosiphonaceae bacterium]
MQGDKRARLIGMAFLALALIAPAAGRPAGAAPAPRCFPATAFCLEGSFLAFWERNGGLPVFGFPIVELAERELNRDTGATHPTQWLERYRFEAHPENQAPYDIQLGRLGEQRLVQLGIDWRGLPQDSGPQDGCLWFAETRHNVCDQAGGLGFKRYWQGHGLEFDGAAGTGYAESLALFGLPLTEPRLETNSAGDTVLTQWFERARFEWHPGNADEYKVLLGLLASELLNHEPLPGLEGRIAFTEAYRVWQDGSKLVVATANGARRIVVDDSLGMNPASWSPDGRSLALWSYDHGPGGDLYAIDVASGMRTLLSEDRFYAGRPSWSPDSRQLAYVDNGSLYAMTIQGKQARPLTQGSGHQIINGFWSPAGSEIAFVSWRGFSSGTTDIGIVGSDGGSPRIIRDNARFLAWSPDGERILLQRGADEDPATTDANLYVMNRDGSDVRKLTDYAGDVRLDARWRSAAEIAFVAHPADNPADCAIVKANVDSGARATVPTDGTPCYHPIGWSPDARFLVASPNEMLGLLDLDSGQYAPLNINGAFWDWTAR